MTTLFILSLFKQGYKIKISTLFHLLKGKRTISVLMNGFLYENLIFFQLFPELTEEEFQATLQKLVAEGFLSLQQENLEAVITEKGRDCIQKHSLQAKKESQWLNSYRYGKIDNKIWRLIQFFVQVTSNLSYQNNTYSPLESSPYYQWKMKQLLKNNDRNTIGNRVREELLLVFDQLSNEESQFFALQFSGYRWNGKAEQQVVDLYPAFKSELVRRNACHHFFRVIESTDKVVMLKKVVLDEVEAANNQSMLKTKKLLLSGNSSEKICEIRQMKQSTINDHLLELAIQNPMYSFEQLLSIQHIHFFKALPAACQEWSYTSVKEELPDLDYFSYRMAQILTLHKERGNRYGFKKNTKSGIRVFEL
ncbi:helix-turn-helix domain-containing protein [Enterococcus sp. BWB1-3]|uniref:helix-turn-helix domain-containing protein n=1 Tax=Enterococcus sp. BWB1-3 TaxID=2787713 RepID=UPI0019246690|nr:helix-turn-helix domain-containing protein [Enterococcus sp. BWB1-3]MBL1228602.1 helix-turn-helix domain-containing protein [Enterococcus sp. BWB1-3]